MTFTLLVSPTADSIVVSTCLPIDKCINYVLTAGTYYSPAGLNKTLFVNLSLKDCTFGQVH
jgi:hypothetical protein